MASSVSKLIPSDPEKVMVLRQLHPDVLTCSTPFLRFGRIKVGGRGTIVRLRTGALAVFSPVALTETVRARAADMGAVKYLVALDNEHHIFLEEWHKAYPEARVIGPETLPEARDKQKYYPIPSVNWTLFKAHSPSSSAEPHVTPSVSPEFDDEFEREYVSAHMNKELVFCHKPSRTLIEGDLIFNLPATEQMSRTGESATSGLATRLFTSLQNTQGAALGQKRMLWYAISAGDRPGFNRSIKRIQAWDFDTIVPCHGDVIESGGKGIFEKVMEWHLKAAEQEKK